MAHQAASPTLRQWVSRVKQAPVRPRTVQHAAVPGAVHYPADQRLQDAGTEKGAGIYQAGGHGRRRHAVKACQL